MAGIDLNVLHEGPYTYGSDLSVEPGEYWIGDVEGRETFAICTSEPTARLLSASWELLHKLEAVEHRWGAYVDAGADINGGDAVEWLCDFVGEARAVVKVARE